jgi:hypothetical protein
MQSSFLCSKLALLPNISQFVLISQQGTGKEGYLTLKVLCYHYQDKKMGEVTEKFIKPWTSRKLFIGCKVRLSQCHIMF